MLSCMSCLYILDINPLSIHTKKENYLDICPYGIKGHVVTLFLVSKESAYWSPSGCTNLCLLQ